jgi:hypothetical protein
MSHMQNLCFENTMYISDNALTSAVPDIMSCGFLMLLNYSSISEISMKASGGANSLEH